MANTKAIETLIIVCCHAIWLGVDEAEPTGESEDGWLIEPFQKGETQTFAEHMDFGLETLLPNKSAILVLSGGPTKPQRTSLTEGGSYLDHIAQNISKQFSECLDRTYVEEFATDSFQNILFSLLSFPIFVQDYYARRAKMNPCLASSCHTVGPRNLIVVSHDFKRARFEKLHLPALRYPTNESRFKFIGVDPPFDEQKMQEIRDGDAKRGYGAWKDDLYGTGPLLAGKRIARGWTEERTGRYIEMLKEKLAEVPTFDAETQDLFREIIEFVSGVQEAFPADVPWSEHFESSISRLSIS